MHACMHGVAGRSVLHFALCSLLVAWSPYDPGGHMAAVLTRYIHTYIHTGMYVRSVFCGDMELGRLRVVQSTVVGLIWMCGWSCGIVACCAKYSHTFTSIPSTYTVLYGVKYLYARIGCWKGSEWMFALVFQGIVTVEKSTRDRNWLRPFPASLPTYAPVHKLCTVHTYSICSYAYVHLWIKRR